MFTDTEALTEEDGATYLLMTCSTRSARTTAMSTSINSTFRPVLRSSSTPPSLRAVTEFLVEVTVVKEPREEAVAR